MKAKKIIKKPVKKVIKKTAKKSKDIITKNMTFSEAMQKDPEVAWTLMQNGMHCVGCGMGMYETIEQGAMIHGLDADKLIKELNSKLNKKK